MDDLGALRAFVAVVETGSFSLGAQRLGLSRSRVSRLVAAVETELGVRLLHRTTRHLGLTEPGQSYFERCRRILLDLEDANQMVSRAQALPRGVLRITAPVAFGSFHVAPALPEFLRRFPEVSLHLALSDRFVDLIEDGFDVAVRIGRLEESSLMMRRLCPVRRVVCASPTYLAEHGTPSVPEDLERHQCLVHTDLVTAEWRFLRPGEGPFTVATAGRCRSNNGDAIRALALGGMGIAYLPTFFVGDDIRAGRLQRLLGDFIPLDTHLHTIWPPGRQMLPKLRAFIDFLVERLSPTPYWDEGIV